MSDAYRITPAFTTIQRTNDWKAHVTGNPKKWEAGHSEAEAIGKLMITLAGPVRVIEPDKLYHVTYLMPCPGGHFCVYEVEWGCIAASVAPSEDRKDYTVQREVQVGEKYYCERCTSLVYHPHNCDDPNNWEAGRL